MAIFDDVLGGIGSIAAAPFQLGGSLLGSAGQIGQDVFKGGQGLLGNGGFLNPLVNTLSAPGTAFAQGLGLENPSKFGLPSLLMAGLMAGQAPRGRGLGYGLAGMAAPALAGYLMPSLFKKFGQPG